MYETLAEEHQRILAVVREARAEGHVPSYREIGAAVGIASTATVHRHLKALETMGFLRLGEGQRRAIELARESPPVSVPLVGKIAAGTPITAEQQIDERYCLPRELLGAGRLFMLQVAGHSMTGAGVLDGDYVVVREQPTAENGEMVAAQLDNAEPEATVKYWSVEGERRLLLPASAGYEPIDGSRARILGKVVAVVRGRVR
ncbi:MAG TPA: transcriptional repressor LexA [Actinomycetota bacterium]|nr:transcriptional repressor LexA [Actinomycetota bacterium]